MQTKSFAAMINVPRSATVGNSWGGPGAHSKNWPGRGGVHGMEVEFQFRCVERSFPLHWDMDTVKHKSPKCLLVATGYVSWT